MIASNKSDCGLTVPLIGNIASEGPSQNAKRKGFGVRLLFETIKMVAVRAGAPEPQPEESVSKLELQCPPATARWYRHHDTGLSVIGVTRTQPVKGWGE
jgi:hypothetical protein